MQGSLAVNIIRAVPLDDLLIEFKEHLFYPLLRVVLSLPSVKSKAFSFSSSNGIEIFIVLKIIPPIKM
jgi:hypothetical protein